MKFPDPERPLEQQDEEVLHAMLVWGEGRGEPSDGRCAIAHIPLERMKRRISMGRKSGNTLRETILSPWQFSCFNANDPNRAKLLRPVEHEGLGLWAACWRTALEARMGQSVSPVPGATHYVVRRLWSRPTAVNRRPKWFEEPSIKSGRTRFLGLVGSHVFARTD